MNTWDIEFLTDCSFNNLAILSALYREVNDEESIAKLLKEQSVKNSISQVFIDLSKILI